MRNTLAIYGNSKHHWYIFWRYFWWIPFSNRICDWRKENISFLFGVGSLVFTWIWMIIYDNFVPVIPFQRMLCSLVTARSVVLTMTSWARWHLKSGADKIKHQNSASPAFVRGTHRWPADSPHKGQYHGNVSICWRHHVLTLLPFYTDIWLALALTFPPDFFRICWVSVFQIDSNLKYKR